MPTGRGSTKEEDKELTTFLEEHGLDMGTETKAFQDNEAKIREIKSRIKDAKKKLKKLQIKGKWLIYNSQVQINQPRNR